MRPKVHNMQHVVFQGCTTVTAVFWLGLVQLCNGWGFANPGFFYSTNWKTLLANTSTIQHVLSLMVRDVTRVQGIVLLVKDMCEWETLKIQTHTHTQHQVDVKLKTPAGLGEACWSDEDYIGRIARVTRKSHSVQLTPSSIRKSLINYRREWAAARNLKDGWGPQHWMFISAPKLCSVCTCQPAGLRGRWIWRPGASNLIP